MQTIETTGKTLADATEAAAKQLGAKADDLKVTVLEEHKGLFGKATVRIRAEMSGASAPVAEAPAAPEPMKEAPAKEAKPARTPRAPKAAQPKTEAAPEPAAFAEMQEAPPEAPSGRDAGVAEATEEDSQRMLELVKEVLQAGDLEVTAKMTGTSGRYVNVELDGKDVAHLVGKHGEVLNALQYVINIMSNQKYGNGIRATLDGNNYRHRREEALTKLATRIADQVRERGEEAVLDALPAFERRIVHKALAEYPGVSTYSEGEEPNRRVVIGPVE
jgi:spoIIIJ-associated protein